MERTEAVIGVAADLLCDRLFDAASLVGVLHHLSGDRVKEAVFRDIALRLKTGAMLILAGNRYAQASQRLMPLAWMNARA